MSAHLIVGGAGFIAITLIERLLAEGNEVIAVDDLSRGSVENIERFSGRNGFTFEQIDCNDVAKLTAFVGERGGIDHVWHLAANSDIPAGVADPNVDLQQTFMTTFNLLIVMKNLGIEELHFASSSAIYGDLDGIAVREDSGPLEPISNYGAMKLASEAQIRAAVEAWLPRANIFRFPNVVGTPATHGVILDFVRKLRKDPAVLPVLGNGTQKKAYLHVEELVDAMLFIQRGAEGRYNVFNIGPSDDGVTVRFIAETVRDRVSPTARIDYGSEGRGWIGDVPRFHYSIDRLATFGWKPSLSSAEAITRAVAEIAIQER